MKLAIRRRVISYNPAEGCETLPPVRHTKADFFKDFSIVERIAEEADETWAGLGYGLFIRLQGTLGLRFGEAAALRRRSVDLLEKPPRLRITENLTEIGGRLDFGSPTSHATRWVPLSPELAAAVESHRENAVPALTRCCSPLPAANATTRTRLAAGARSRSATRTSARTCGCPSSGISGSHRRVCTFSDTPQRRG